MSLSAMKRGLLLLLCLGALVLLVQPENGFAQARNPFSVGISEGGGSPDGVTGWILAQQQKFDRLMRGAVRAIATDAGAFWSLLGLAFAYGVFHAAGPGHGKAVLAAYMLANERALKRGLVMAGLAALLQASVAIAMVVGLSFLFGATAHMMRNAARMIEIASYGAIALLGLALVWRKGRAFLTDWRAQQAKPSAASIASRFQCVATDDPSHVHGPDCGHFHMPDPAKLGGAFDWRDAAGAVVAAGLRPCSGAILVLVFSAAQGILYAGIAATFAMAAGTAATTGLIAIVAVYAKGLAEHLNARRGTNGLVLLRGLELAAAIAVLALGAGLLTGTLAGSA